MGWFKLGLSIVLYGMSTPITYLSTDLPDTELWIKAREVPGAGRLGWVLVDGRNDLYKVRVPGTACTHVYSPELVALHKEVMAGFDRVRTGMKYGQVWVRIGLAFLELFEDRFDYHRTLMKVNEGETLEAPQGRIVAALRELAVEERGQVAQRLSGWADALEGWRYESQ